MSQSFYRAFEDTHRGSREQILQRLDAYNAFTKPYVQLAETHQPPQAVDIGCGRGEWLQHLSAQGFAARGVDLDAGMLAACQELNLDTVQGDGIVYLAQQPANSLAVVSAFHLVEHISFEQITALAESALAALQPGGLLIFETPNPDNLLVAGRDFYLDPTHIKPLPSALLQFLLQYVGFARVKVVPLNENAYFREADAQLSLWDVISGVSPDYAVIAQKDGDGSYSLLEALNPAFAEQYGVSLAQMAQRYQQNAQYHLDNVLSQAKAQHAQQTEVISDKEAQLLARIEALQYEYQEQQTATESRIEALVQDYQGYQGYAEARLTALEQDYQGYQGYVEERFMKIFRSANWRIMAPLRYVQYQVGRVRNKGLRRTAIYALNRLGLWRLSQKLQPHSAATSFQQAQWVPPELEQKATSTAVNSSRPARPTVHPNEWVSSPCSSITHTQSPLEKWTRDHE